MTLYDLADKYGFKSPLETSEAVYRQGVLGLPGPITEDLGPLVNVINVYMMSRVVTAKQLVAEERERCLRIVEDQHMIGGSISRLVCREIKKKIQSGERA